MKFLSKYALVFLALSILFLVGCGPLVWIQDALNILPVVGASISAVLALIGLLSGGAVPVALATTITAVITEVMKGLGDVEQMVEEYKNANPPPAGLLQSIETGIQAVIDHLSSFLLDTGITNAAVQAKIQAILQLALNQLKAWQSLLPALHPPPALSHFTVIRPMTKQEFKQAVNAVLSAPTGDTEVDAALSKVKHL